jgi:predicted nucleotidyltransferase
MVLEMNAKLKGRNRVAHFRQVAEELASKIAAYNEVAGIMFIGGLVRGFADEFSDIDIVALLKRRNEDLRKKLVKLWLDKERLSNIEIDFEVHSIGDFKKQTWDEVDRWEFSKAKIVFDPNGETKKVLEEKLKVSKHFWIRRIVLCTEYLKWYCCPAKKDVGTIAEVWIKRGDLTSAHHCLNYATELIIKLIFAINKEFLPAPKWRLFQSYNLEWLPKNYKKLIKEAMQTGDLSLENFKRRLRALRKLGREVIQKIEDDTGLNVDLISKYYVEKVLHQTWIPSHH